MATKSLMSIAANSGMECFTVESHASRVFLETTNAITFTDGDMEVEHPDHQIGRASCRERVFLSV